KPAGRRGLELQPTPVERVARRLKLAVATPASLKGADAQAAFAAHGAAAAVVVAYGLILPKGVLDAVPLGCFNLHASLLPRWRGAAPINRAIMAGDRKSTRLNSSHVEISYAVFCLKKKKETQRPQLDRRP